jgi:hypothetical protein
MSVDYEEEDYPRPKTRLIGVVAFTIGLANKQYGGREEGGWYYNTFKPQRVFYVAQEQRVHFWMKLERFCARMNEAEGRYPPSSVLCHGYWTVVQDAITEDQPQERPYYS